MRRVDAGFADAIDPQFVRFNATNFALIYFGAMATVSFPECNDPKFLLYPMGYPLLIAHRRCSSTVPQVPNPVPDFML